MVDAGTDAETDAGEVITDCDVALAADEGRACDLQFACTEGPELFCAVRRARCVDGVLEIDEHVWLAEAPPSCPTAAVASLEGSGPSGPFTLDAATASLSHAFAVNAQLLFSGGAAYSECGSPRMTIPLWDVRTPELDYVGTHDVSASLILDGAVHTLTGTVEVTADDTDAEGRTELAGTITLAAEGIEVSGPFQLTECLDLDRSGP